MVHGYGCMAGQNRCGDAVDRCGDAADGRDGFTSGGVPDDNGYNYDSAVVYDCVT